MKETIWALLALSAAASLATAQEPGTAEFVWDAEKAEHLWNRAGFGAPVQEVERAVALGQAAFVDELLAGAPDFEEPYYRRTRGSLRGMLAEMAQDERKDAVGELKTADREQLQDFLGWWVDRMVRGEDPLRERVTLFWHGHFTSSYDDVRDSYEMIVQNQLFRTRGLGSFRALLRSIAHDPAMLEYLDNDSNRKGSPNENFARELMELFTLGEGNYTEQDVKEAARAFTGWTDADGRYRFNRRVHDRGDKSVLGVSGPLDGDDLIDILLAQEACPRFLTAKLLRYFEGAAPSGERTEHYAGVLRASDYDVGAFLRALFLDPAFYRPEVLGTRIAGPIDFMVGTARRLGVDPPERVILIGASVLGQRLFHPPNVKGWEGGESWITTAALMQRGNLAGVLLGHVTMDDFLDYDPLEDPSLDPFLGDSAEMVGMDAVDDAPDGRSARRRLGELRRLKGVSRGWRPRLHLTARLRRHGTTLDDEGIVQALSREVLAVRIGPATSAELAAWLAGRRADEGLSSDRLLEDSAVSEPILRDLAHVLLSLPEAQLN